MVELALSYALFLVDVLNGQKGGVMGWMNIIGCYHLTSVADLHEGGLHTRGSGSTSMLVIC